MGETTAVNREYDFRDMGFWQSYKDEVLDTMLELDVPDDVPLDHPFWERMGALRVRHLKEMPYKRYLNSEEWEQTRRAVIKRDGARCRLCNTAEGLQVHHRTYDRRGAEALDDLTLLCADCHSNFHKQD